MSEDRVGTLKSVHTNLITLVHMHEERGFQLPSKDKCKSHALLLVLVVLLSANRAAAW